MKNYTLKVQELHIHEREYYVEAKNKAEARLKAKNDEWDDANEGDWCGVEKTRILSIKEQK